MEDILELKKTAIEKVVNSFKNGDDSTISRDLLFLLIVMNGQYNENNLYDHELKKLLFETNCIRNPLGVKYKEKDYAKITQALSRVIRIADGINKHSVDADGVLQDGFVFEAGLIDDCIEMLTYTECFYKMNIVNSKRMDDAAVSSIPFFEQLSSLLIFVQDQCRIAKENYNQLIAEEGVTGLELSVSNREVEFTEGQKGSISDTFEANFESVNQIIHYLFYRHGKNLEPQLDLSKVDFSMIHPYKDVDFQTYMYIAHQRHLLLGTEESIRYGNKKLDYGGKTDNGTLRFIASIENEDKYKARMYGIFRREYQLRSRVMCDVRNAVDVGKAEKAISILSNELIKLQNNGYIMFDLENFKPDKTIFSEAERIAKPKERIVEALTKQYYFNVNVSGVVINDLIKSYGYLSTLAEIIYHSSSAVIDKDDQSTYIRELCIAKIDYLSSELSRIYGFAKSYADLLIDRFVFHESNNREDDVFAQPLIKVSQSQVVLCYTMIDQVNIDRAIERQFIRYDKNVSAVGYEFEKQFLKALQKGYVNGMTDKVRKPIPNFSVNENKIEYTAYDGKQIEFDIVSTLGDYLILTELKALMTSYDVSDLESRKDNVKKAVQQLIRRAASVREDWEIFKSMVSIVLPDKAYDEEHIILVACTDAYDYTPTKYGKVFVTDDSTFLKYFTSPYVDAALFNCDRIEIKQLKCLWKDGIPKADEFMEYLVDPDTIHPFADYMEKVVRYIPIMDEQDAEIYFEDYQFSEDPIKATALGKS